MKTRLTQEELKRLRTELNFYRKLRAEKNRPTLWINKDASQVEIHFKNKTILCSVNGIDRETPRAISDDMAKGSNYKQIPFKNDEELKRALK